MSKPREYPASLGSDPQEAHPSPPPCENEIKVTASNRCAYCGAPEGRGCWWDDFESTTGRRRP